VSDRHRIHNEREKCVLDSVNADEIDNLIYSRIISIITNPVQYTKEWFKDADLEELKTRFASLRRIDLDKTMQLHNGYDQLLKISNDEAQNYGREAPKN